MGVGGFALALILEISVDGSGRALGLSVSFRYFYWLISVLLWDELVAEPFDQLINEMALLFLLSQCHFLLMFKTVYLLEQLSLKLLLLLPIQLLILQLFLNAFFHLLLVHPYPQLHVLLLVYLKFSL